MIRQTVILAVLALTSYPADRGQTSRGTSLNVTGDWTYDTPDLRVQEGSSSLLCQFRGITLSLVQQDSVVTGTAHDGSWVCTGQAVKQITPGPIEHGIVRGDSIIFRLELLVNRGKVSGKDGAGIVTMTSPPGSGTFSMHRK
jgi:hypothetical protein